MKQWLVIPLVFLVLQRVDSQNNDTGNALPCGDDNLSCLNPANPDNPNICLTTDQLCDGTNDCASGLDEGTNFANLDCTYTTIVACSCLILFPIFSLTDTGTGQFGAQRMFRCSGGKIIQLEALCDGFNNCTGEDETNLICESKLYPNSPSETTLFSQRFPDSTCNDAFVILCIIIFCRQVPSPLLRKL